MILIINIRSLLRDLDDLGRRHGVGDTVAGVLRHLQVVVCEAVV